MFSSPVSQLQANDPRKEVKAQGRNGRDSSLNCSKIGKYARNKPLFFLLCLRFGVLGTAIHIPHIIQNMYYITDIKLKDMAIMECLACSKYSTIDE